MREVEEYGFAIMAMPEQYSWQQQPGESIKAFQAFVIYRNMEPNERSLQRVASELAKSSPLVKRWSARWEWVERASDWDSYQELRRLERLIGGEPESIEERCEKIQVKTTFEEQLKVYIPAFQELIDEGVIRLDGQTVPLAAENQDEGEDGGDEMLITYDESDD